MGVDLSVVQRQECPACGCTKFSKSRSSNRGDLELLERIGQSFSGTETWRDHFDYHRCSACDLLFNTTYPAADALEKLYEEIALNDVGQSAPALEATHRWLATKLIGPKVKTFGRGISVLELGPDIGRFAGHLRDLVEVKSFDFVEPNVTAWPQLRASIPETRQLTRSFRELENSGPHDLVVAHHVLDHVVSLRETLGSVKNLTRQGSLLSIVVHDHSSILARLMGDKWPPYCLQHPQLFTAKALQNLLEQNNWTLVRKSRQQNYVGVRATTANLMNIFLSKSLSAPKRDLVVPMRFGNLAFVAQRLK